MNIITLMIMFYIFYFVISSGFFIPLCFGFFILIFVSEIYKSYKMTRSVE